MDVVKPPAGLGKGGRLLWRDVTAEHVLDPVQRVQLTEACRAKDRLDKLDELLRGDVDTWARLTIDINSDGDVYDLRIAAALTQANATATTMKQLLAALRLPDEVSGKRPQQRGGARGAYKDSGKAGRVSSIDRARAARDGA